MTALACGVDVGGTKILGGVVDDQGAIVEELRVTSPATDPDAIEQAIAAVVLELKGRHEISSVGVGAAGYIDKSRSIVMFAPNIAWRDVNLRHGLEKQVDLPVVIENDANAAAWGEFAFGAGADVDDLLLVTVGTGSRDGKAVSFTGLTNGAWFGEGTVLKNEARRYDAVAVRETRIALMDRATFMGLFENSVGFNRFLVRLLNERLGQFMGLLEHGRMLDAKARLARSIATLFNPFLYPDMSRHLDITQEELGAISGISRQNTNQCLKALEKEGLLRVEYGGVTIVDLEKLRGYGE